MQPILKTTHTVVVCPTCQGDIIKRKGRYGDFYGCSNFPGCTQKAISLTVYTKMEQLLQKQNGQSEPEFKSTLEQQNIFGWVVDRANNPTLDISYSLLVEACAGSGKTTTIAQAIQLLQKQGVRDVIYLVFNTKNREEAQAKGLPAMTTHQHGFASIRSHMTAQQLGKPKIDQRKTVAIAKDIIGRRMDDMKWMIWHTSKIISLAKNNLVAPSPKVIEHLIISYSIDLHPQENLSQLYQFIWEVWEISINQWDTIDFDDMLFFPIYHNLNVKRVEWVFADEVQDFNPCQIELLKRTVEKYLVAVGDRNQSIYAFRGAALYAMDDIKVTFGAEEMSLSVTFRVPLVGVRYINETFSTIKFIAWEHAKPGKIETVNEDHLMRHVKDRDLVLCRMNAPLIKHVFELLRQGRKATIIGRDLASQLTVMIERFCNRGAVARTDTVDLLERLKQYEQLETRKLIGFGRVMAAEILSDKVETIIAISDGCDNAQSIRLRIDEIFSKDQGDGVAFSSVHKAKGVEAKRVFILRPDLMPHPAASGNSAQEQQEMNIEYVASTRFLSEMYFVSSVSKN